MKSLLNRRVTVGLTVLSIACSAMLLLGVERIRQESRRSFLSTVSGTDLIVGARSGGPQLLLQSVFNLGFPTRNLSRESYTEIVNDPAVAWVIPLSTGDMHRGFRVVGTTSAYWEHFRFAGDRGLAMAAGAWFGDDEEAVLGAEAARELGYALGDPVVVSHGAGEISFVHHDAHPFHVSGILAPTGTPLDRTILVGLAGVDAMHADFVGANDQPTAGAIEEDPLAAALASARKREAAAHDHDHDHDGHDHEHHLDEGEGSLSALLVGLKNRAAVLGLQRKINESDHEALSAILPGVALQELWGVLAVIERVLLFLGGFVVVVGLMGMLSNLLGTLDQRRREMAILRSVGARPVHLITLMVGETFIVTLAGAIVGVALLSVLLAVGAPVLETRYGLYLDLAWPGATEWRLLGAIMVAGILVGLIPALRAYRLSLLDGLTPRI